MATTQWQIGGDYCETCSCDSVCPCPTSGLAARPSKGFCDAGLVFLRRVVEDAKASGLVARAIERTGARGVSVAPAAK